MTNIFTQRKTGRLHLLLVQFRGDAYESSPIIGLRADKVITVSASTFRMDDPHPGCSWMGPLTDFEKEFSRKT
jgi:hypothetical protein